MEYIITLTKTEGKKIYVDPSFEEGVYLYPGEIRKLMLKDGSRLTKEAFDKIRADYAIPRARRRALGILAKRDKTEWEIRQKLKESFHDTDSIEQALSWLKSMGYVNDLSYARDYIYYKRDKKSARQIRYDLQRKGVSRETIAIAQEEEGAQSIEDLRRSFYKYAARFGGFDENTKRKIYAHFLRKGYEDSLIRQLLREYADARED